MFVPTAAVGAEGVPVNEGDSMVLFVNDALADLSDITNAVVANCVVFVPTSAVGADGVPVRVGEFEFAFVANSSFRLVKLVSTSPIVSGDPF